jgi:hypothetical protein
MEGYQMKVDVRSEKVWLNSLQNTHTVDLNRLIDAGHDIVDTRLDLPKEVKELRLLIGGQAVAVFNHDNIQDLRNFPIYLSKARYHNACIQLVYDPDYLMQYERFSMVDEVMEEERYGEYVEIYDGCDYHTGRIVERVQVPTGNKIKKVIGAVVIETPTMTFEVRAASNNDETYVEVPVRLKVTVDRSCKDDYIKRFNLEVLSENEHQIVGYVTNQIRYQQGLAGLKYSF